MSANRLHNNVLSFLLANAARDPNPGLTSQAQVFLKELQAEAIVLATPVAESPAELAKIPAKQFVGVDNATLAGVKAAVAPAPTVPAPPAPTAPTVPAPPAPAEPMDVLKEQNKTVVPGAPAIEGPKPAESLPVVHGVQHEGPGHVAPPK